MTQKEKLANEYVELKKQFDGEDFKANIRQNQIWWLTKEFKVVELQEKIEAVRNAIAERAKKQAIEAWLETEEGKAFKAANEKTQADINAKRLELREKAYQYARTTVRAILGTAFDITNFFRGRFNVALIKEYNEDNEPVGLFGHEFTIYYDLDYFTNNHHWDMNYGTLGAFKIGDDINRGKFLMGMATFANDPIINSKLKNAMHEFWKSDYELQMEYHKIEADFNKTAAEKAQ